MTHRLLADLVLVVHLGFIVFVVAGGLLALRFRWAPWIHLPAVAWAIYIELSGGTCPLTPLENMLRRAAGESGYASSFVEQYLVPVVYPASLTDSLQQVLAALVAGCNALVYGMVCWRRRAGTR